MEYKVNSQTKEIIGYHNGNQLFIMCEAGGYVSLDESGITLYAHSSSTLEGLGYKPIYRGELKITM